MDVAVVWMDGAPDAEAQKSIAEWGIRHGVHIVAPSDTPPPMLAARDEDSRTVEDALAKARDALAQLDADGAERSLARAEQTLRAHAELPQGAWLMAEVQRGWAARFARIAPTDMPRASRAWAAAEALDGGRVAGVGEPSLPGVHPLPAKVTLDVIGNGSIIWDGMPAKAGAVTTTAGEHQLLAYALGRVVFAQWVNVEDGATIRLSVVSGAPCSQTDFARAPTGVACGDWIMVRKGTGAALSVTRCSREACGSEVVWAPMYTQPIGPVTDTGTFHWPAWATWTLAGIAVLGGTLGIMAAAGVFSPAPPPIVTFKNGGIQQQ